MAYSYFTLKCLEFLQKKKKRYDFIFPGALVYEDVKTVTGKNVEEKLKRW